MQEYEKNMVYLMLKLFKYDGVYGVFTWDPVADGGRGKEMIWLEYEQV